MFVSDSKQTDVHGEWSHPGILLTVVKVLGESSMVTSPEDKEREMTHERILCRLKDDV